MKGPADSPKVSLTGEDFRSAETWEYADDGPGTHSTAWARPEEAALLCHPSLWWRAVLGFTSNPTPASVSRCRPHGS